MCPLPLLLSLGITQKSLALSCLFPPVRCLCTLIRFPLSLLFSGLKSPGSLSFSSYDKYFKCSVVFVALHWTHFSRRITSLSLLVTLVRIQPRVLMAAFARRSHCWLMVRLSSTRTPRAFSAKWKIPWE